MKGEDEALAGGGALGAPVGRERVEQRQPAAVLVERGGVTGLRSWISIWTLPSSGEGEWHSTSKSGLTAWRTALVALLIVDWEIRGRASGTATDVVRRGADGCWRCVIDSFFGGL